MNTIDVTTDPAFSHLRALSDRYPGLVEFAKSAELSPEEFAQLPDGAFAWPEKRAFPIHTKEHTAISVAYSKHAEAVPSHVRGNLQLACDAFSIPAETFTPAGVKTASVEYWLLPSERRFRVASAEDVRYAADALEKRAHDLSEEQRVEAYHNLVKTAESFGVQVDPSLYKFAGQTLTDTEVLADWLEARSAAAESVGSKVAAIEYKNLGQSFRMADKYVSSPADQVKIASCIAELDKVAGIEKFVGRSLPNPILTVWNTNKVASQQVDLNGMYFDQAMLASLPVTFWEDTLGPEFVAEFAPGGVVDPEMLVTVLQTLPADMKATLVTQLSAYR